MWGRSDHRHNEMKVPNVNLDFDVSVRHCLLSTHTFKSHSTSGTDLHTVIRTHHFDFDIRFWPISALMGKTLHRSWNQSSVLSVIYINMGRYRQSRKSKTNPKSTALRTKSMKERMPKITARANTPRRWSKQQQQNCNTIFDSFPKIKKGH